MFSFPPPPPEAVSLPPRANSLPACFDQEWANQLREVEKAIAWAVKVEFIFSTALHLLHSLSSHVSQRLCQVWGRGRRDRYRNVGCSFTDHRRRSEPFCFVSFWHREDPSRNDLGLLRTNKQASKGPKLSGQDEEMNVFIACILVQRRLGDRCVGGSCAGGFFKKTPNLCRGPNKLVAHSSHVRKPILLLLSVFFPSVPCAASLVQ